jgi:hypothetical protein
MDEIIKDSIKAKLHDYGVIQSPDFDKIKLRLNIEASMDLMGENNALSADVIKGELMSNLVYGIIRPRSYLIALLLILRLQTGHY